MKIGKFWKQKKAINDISIIAIIIFIFLGTSIIIPFVNAEFGTTSDVFDNDAFEASIISEAENIPEISAFDTGAFKVITNVVKLAFFDFGNTLGLPFWLDLIYTVLAIILILTVARNVWIGGGG